VVYRRPLTPEIMTYPSRAMNKESSTEFTALQGQYLAFIRTYTLMHRAAPAESDMQHFFRVTPPTVHTMILALERRGLIERVPGKARSIRVLVRDDRVPRLEEPAR
jgi:DNA-binding MarR family transcriptional regulator